MTRACAVMMLGILVSACAAQAPASPAGGSVATDAPLAKAPKKLTIAIQREYDTADGGEGAYLMRDALVFNREGVQVPQIATELISVEKGTWRINADGTMDTTWKIRPNVKWHDGTPFTSD